MYVKHVLVTLVLAGFVLTGCAKKDGEPASKEGAAKAEATTKSNHNKLQGTWTFDMDAMLKGDPRMAKMVKTNPEVRAQITRLMTDANITIDKDSVAMNGQGKERKYSYTVVSQDGNTVVLESTQEGKEKKGKMTFEFTDDDNMRGREDGKGSDMFLTRAK
jgi:PBP1b-binding outer membrane lipoprotein LpoB